MPSRYTSTGRVLSLGDDTAAWLALLRSQATLAWDGANVGLTAWRDVVQGVVATSGGSGTTIGALNGRPAAVFSGAGRYLTDLTIPQPYAIVAVASATSLADLNVVVGSGDGLTRLYYILGNLTIFASPMRLSGTPIDINAPFVARARANGATSSISLNESALSSGEIGTGSFSALQIATRNNGMNSWIGPIAHVSIYHGDKLANAATVAAAAQAHYRIAS